MNEQIEGRIDGAIALSLNSLIGSINTFRGKKRKK